MRIIETKVYKYDELNDQAKSRARDWYRDGTAYSTDFMDDILSSLKAVFKASGIKLTGWNLGAYNRNNYVTFDLGDAGGLKGKRALAWIENHLLGQFRIGPAEFAKHRKDYTGYGAAYRIGKIKPCPLTGVSFDEDYLEALDKDIKGGATLKEAFQNLADVCGDLCDKALDYQNSDDAVEDSIRINEYEFTEDGKIN